MPHNMSCHHRDLMSWVRFEFVAGDSLLEVLTGSNCDQKVFRDTFENINPRHILTVSSEI